MMNIVYKKDFKDWKIFSIDGRLESIWVSLDDGMITVEPPLGCMVDTFCKYVSDWMSEESNFWQEIQKAFSLQKVIKKIRFTFNEITLTVTEPIDGESLYNEWNKKWQENEDAWLLTIEGRQFLYQLKLLETVNGE